MGQEESNSLNEEQEEPWSEDECEEQKSPTPQKSFKSPIKKITNKFKDILNKTK